MNKTQLKYKIKYNKKYNKMKTLNQKCQMKTILKQTNEITVKLIKILFKNFKIIHLNKTLKTQLNNTKIK